MFICTTMIAYRFESPYPPDDPPPLWAIRVHGVPVQDVSRVGLWLRPLCDVLDNVSVSHCRRHLCQPVGVLSMLYGTSE